MTAFNKIFSYNWKVGGSNIDEDPHFSSYYHAMSTDNTSEYFNYGILISLYKEFSEQYYIRTDIAEKVAKLLLNKLQTDVNFFLVNDQAIRNLSDEIIKYCDNNLSSILDFSNAAKIYSDVSELTLNLYKVSRIPQCLDRASNVFTDFLLDIILKSGSTQIMQDFNILTSPDEVTLFQLARERRKKIREIILTKNLELENPVSRYNHIYFILDNNIKKLISEYQLEFSHIKYHGYSNRSNESDKEFVDKLFQEDFDSTESPSISNKLNLIKKLNLDITNQSYFMIYWRFGTTKMYRRFSQIKLFRKLDECISYLSKHWNIPEIYLRHLTHIELKECIEQNISPLDKIPDIKNRINGVIFLYENGKCTPLTGTEYKLLSNHFTNKIKKDVLSGITAYPGNIIGFAKKISRDTDAFNPGDILVSESTDPDLISKIKIAKGVLTEQGGATSHACIICRELKIPCIVGIQSLLDSVNDGDLLKVNTYTGEIVKLSKFTHIHSSDSSVNLGGKFTGLKLMSDLGFKNYIPTTFAINMKSIEDKSHRSKLINELKVVCEIINKPIILRSSASNEDGLNKSLAGHYKSYTNIPPNANKIINISQKIYNHAIRSVNAISPEEFSIIIQPQFISRISGVFFSKNIVTNDTNEIYLEYAAGQGENLVSGKIIPNILRVSKDSFEILEHTINDNTIISLEHEILKIVDIGLRIRNKVSYEIDIEFGLNEEGQYSIFQMRPITT